MGIIEIILILIFGFAFLKVGLTDYPELLIAVVIGVGIYMAVKKSKK